MPIGCAMMALVQAARRSLAERPSRISCVSRFAPVSASFSVSASVTPVPSRSVGLTLSSSASALICAEAPWTSATRMFNERRTAMSSRILAKFSSVTMAPSMLTMKIFSRKRGMYWRMPRRSVGFTLRYSRMRQFCPCRIEPRISIPFSAGFNFNFPNLANPDFLARINTNEHESKQILLRRSLSR